MNKSNTNKSNTKKKKPLFRFLKFSVGCFYKKRKLLGLENIPDQECIIVGNHAQMHGPLVSELQFPYKKKIWATGKLMDKTEASQYCFEDFWGYKPKRSQWFYKGLAKAVSPICVYILSNADTIPVYKDTKVISTFKRTVETLKDGSKVIIFPECHTPYNNIINDFQENFVDVAKLYYKNTQKELFFVPMYNAPKIKTIIFGEPIKYDCTKDINKQRKAICDYLKTQITNLAQSLPVHTVIPYANISKKKYPKSK